MKPWLWYHHDGNHRNVVNYENLFLSFLLTTFTYSKNKRCQNELLGAYRFTSALEWTHAWLFRCCSLFKNRMMGYSSVIVSINTVAR